MESTIAQLGVGGIFAILLIREVLNFVQKWRSTPENPKTSTHHNMAELQRQVAELHQWLYVQRPFDDALQKIAQAIEIQAHTQRETIDILRDLKDDIRDLKRLRSN